MLAGPGTGKTRTLVELYAGLVEQGLAARSEVLVLTFSTSAAGEIGRRLDERLRDSYDRAYISTFHSFCARLLRDHRPGPQPLLMSGFQEWLVMRRVLAAADLAGLGPLAPLRGLDSFAQDALAFVALLKQNLEGPAPFALRAETAGSPRMRGLAHVYAAYQAALGASAMSDFRDLVADAIHMLEASPRLLERVRDGFRYILVDEFQDVDPAQFALLKLLAPPESGPRLVVFGDPDQSIYGFRGTLPRLLTDDFPRVYGDASVSLEVSHRCPPAVLDAGERLLRVTQAPAGRAQRFPVAAGAPPPQPQVVVGREANAVDEAFFVAREIRRQVLEGGCRPGQFAILLRSTATASGPFEEAIRALGLPYEVRGIGALARNEVVRFLLTYLRALGSPADPEAMERVLESGLSGVPARAVGRLRRHALEEARPFARVVNRVLFRLHDRDPARWPLPWGEAATGEAATGEAAGPEAGAGATDRDPSFMEYLGEAELDALHAAVTAYHRLRWEAERLPLAALAWRVLLDAGVLRRLMEQDLPQEARDQALANLRATTEALAEIEEVLERLAGQRPSLADLGGRLESLVARAVDETEAAPATADAVQVMTIHQSKGLEFDHVFLAGFAHGVFPLPARPHPLLDEAEQEWLRDTLTGFRPTWTSDPAAHAAEEARLAYVGMTRARRRLYITYADEYDEPAGPSPFLELAAPVAEERALTRAGGRPEPADLLTLGEAETELALHAALLGEEARARAAALGADVDFIAAPTSGMPFDPATVRPTGVQPGHFSATAINDYLRCPRMYWFNHHPGLAAPTRSVEMARGSFLHEVLEDFHNREAEWRHREPESQREWLQSVLEPRLHDYLASVESVLERRAEEQEVRRILDNYIRFATGRSPIRRLGTLATELKFTLELDGAEIRGKIDRINDTGDGTCEVVDYKTGRGAAATKKYAEYFGPQMHDVQLALYYLACRDGVDGDGRPIALRPRWLSLWFPKEWTFRDMRQVLFAVGEPAPGVNQYVQQPVSEEDLERGREVVLKAIRDIRDGDFAPRPRDVIGTCRSWFGCPHAQVCSFGGQPVDA